mgnify:CR=1 FL=1
MKPINHLNNKIKRFFLFILASLIIYFFELLDTIRENGFKFYNYRINFKWWKE